MDFAYVRFVALDFRVYAVKGDICAIPVELSTGYSYFRRVTVELGYCFKSVC